MVDVGSDLRIVVIGLGYVGLPLAVALAKQVRRDRVRHRRGAGSRACRRGHRPHRRNRPRRACGISAELDVRSAKRRARPTSISSPCRPRSIRPTSPISARCRRRRGPMAAAGRSGQRPTIVYESTVYPGVTEDVCGGLLAEAAAGARARFPAWLQPRADQPGRQGPHRRQDHQGHRRRGCGDGSSSWPRSMAR